MTKSLLFLILVAVICLTGCSDSPSSSSSKATFTSLDRAELVLILSENKLSALPTIILDKSYSIPTKTWIEKDFSESFSKFTFGLGIKDKYLTDSLDCDDIAQGAAFCAKYLHWKETKVKRGLAFGEFHYNSSSVGPHAINIAIVSDAGKINVVFYEPQRRVLIELSDKERDSCAFIRF